MGFQSFGGRENRQGTQLGNLTQTANEGLGVVWAWRGSMGSAMFVLSGADMDRAVAHAGRKEHSLNTVGPRGFDESNAPPLVKVGVDARQQRSRIRLNESNHVLSRLLCPFEFVTAWAGTQHEKDRATVIHEQPPYVSEPRSLNQTID